MYAIVEEKKDDDSDSTTQEISYTCGDETIDKSTFNHILFFTHWPEGADEG